MLSLLIALAIAAATIVSTALLFKPASIFRYRNRVSQGAIRTAASPNASVESNDAILTPELLIDVGSRYNEVLLANIDALDVALVGIIGLDVAFAIFAVDKLRQLDCRTEWEAIACIIACAALCLIGYICGFRSTRDVIAPKPLIADYELRGVAAITMAIDVLGRHGLQNAWVRSTKRITAMLAVIVFLASGLTVMRPIIVGGHGERPSPSACKVLQ